MTSDKLDEALADLPVIAPQGHGKPDHCSEHGDIPGTMSIKAHIESQHGMTYEQWGVLRDLRDQLETGPLTAPEVRAIAEAIEATGNTTLLNRFLASKYRE